MKNFKFNISNFGDLTNIQGTAVVGHRFFIGANPIPVIATDIVDGVRSTPEVGGEQNTVEANKISSTRELNALGLLPAGSLTYEYLYDKDLVKKISGYTNKTMWIYEERVNQTQDPAHLGEGQVYKVKFGAITLSGQETEGLKTFSNTAVMESVESYLAIPTYTAGAEGQPEVITWEYVGLATGEVKSDLSSETSTISNVGGDMPIADLPSSNSKTTTK